MYIYMKPIYIYIHICTKNNWLSVLTNLIMNIKNSGLYDIIDKIRCFVLGTLDEIPEILNDKKIIIVKKNPDCHLYEKFTLNNLYDDCHKEDFYILYLHTKGITRGNLQPVKDWVEYLIHFNMYRHKEIIKLLEEYDCVGVNLQDGPHYSGNFWWSKSSHIVNLKREIPHTYQGPEFWVTSKSNNCKYISLYSSNINHYNTRYPPENYILKECNYHIVSF